MFRIPDDRSHVDIADPMNGEDAELISHPCRVGVYGGSGSGKTTWLLNLLRDKRVHYDRVIWVCPEYSCKQPEIAKLGEKGTIGKKKTPFLLIPATPGWTERLEEAITEGEDENGKPVMKQAVVLDDLIGHTGTGHESRVFSELFTGGRHRNLSIFELLQRCFPNSAARTHRLNTQMHVVFALGARDEAKRLFRQCAPEHWRALSKAYDEITSDDEHGYVIVDQRHHRKYPALRFRTGLEECLILDE